FGRPVSHYHVVDPPVEYHDRCVKEQVPHNRERDNRWPPPVQSSAGRPVLKARPAAAGTPLHVSVQSVDQLILLQSSTSFSPIAIAADCRVIVRFSPGLVPLLAERISACLQ